MLLLYALKFDETGLSPLSCPCPYKYPKSSNLNIHKALTILVKSNQSTSHKFLDNHQTKSYPVASSPSLLSFLHHMDQNEFTELIPGLPEDIALDCLTRVHYSAHQLASSVCDRWFELMHSTDFYYHRKKTGRTHKVACLVQAIPVTSHSEHAGPPSYGISLFDPVSFSWDRVDPIPKYRNGLPLFCGIASTQGKIFILGGWNPSSWSPVNDVFMYDFATHKWTQCADMPTSRSFFALGAIKERIFIAGGHDESKNALDSAWVFNINNNEWTELPRMNEERDECEGIIIGSEFWVVSGYETEIQGAFKSTVESFDPETGEWKQVDECVWEETQCPKSRVGVGRNGKLINWAECDPAARVGVCGVDLGDRAVITGSDSRGIAQGAVVVAENNGGQFGKLTKAQVPVDFLGFVQSGCCLEI